jgi:AcrR family transcriptional regulator
MNDLASQSFSEPERAIMKATYQVLCEYGYADLTIQQIADEYGKTTTAVHYHYDTKDKLLTAFLDYLLEELADSVHNIRTTNPENRLKLLLDELLVKSENEPALSIALLEMQSQTPYKEPFRERFKQIDEYIRYSIKTVVNDGIDKGAFNDVDADHIARSLMTIVNGGRTRAVVLDDMDNLEIARQAAHNYVNLILQGPAAE